MDVQSKKLIFCYLLMYVNQLLEDADRSQTTEGDVIKFSIEQELTRKDFNKIRAKLQRKFGVKIEALTYDFYSIGNSDLKITGNNYSSIHFYVNDGEREKFASLVFSIEKKKSALTIAYKEE